MADEYEDTTYVVSFTVRAVEWDELPFDEPFLEGLADALPKEWWYGSNDDAWGVIDMSIGSEGEDNFTRVSR